MTRAHRAVLAWATMVILAPLSRVAQPQVAQPHTTPPQAAQRPAPIPISPDSARGDAEAFRTLPPSVREVLDIHVQLQPDGGDPGLICVPLSATSDGSRRQRVQGRLSDGLGVVVFARASRNGVLSRVEFVRRLPSGGQRGYTWDAQGDATTAMEWPPGSTDAQSYPVPKGSPIPRAVRGLGRIVLTWPCREG